MPFLGIIKLGGGPGDPQRNVTPLSHLTVRLREGRVCRIPRAQPHIPLLGGWVGICGHPPSPHSSSPFPQLVEHSVVPSCFQLWSRLRRGGCGAAGTRLSGRWGENACGCLTGKACADPDVSTSGAPLRMASLSSVSSFSSPSSGLLPSGTSWPLKGSPRRGRCIHRTLSTDRGDPFRIRNYAACHHLQLPAQRFQTCGN